MAKSPISRVGGKYYLAPKIIRLFPEHSRYIEPFGGAMHVLFRKEPSPVEIYNDIDSGLVTFFKVVKTKPDELIKMLEFSLYSRESFLIAKDNIGLGSDVEQAYNFYTVNRQCFGGKMKTWGIPASTKLCFFDYEKRLKEAHRRLQSVYIENLDWREIFRKYDAPGTLFYLDPPYMFNGVRGNDKFYDNELTAADHAELVEILKSIKGKFLLSGYENSLYDCFERISMGEVNMCVNKCSEGRRVKRTEYVWKTFETVIN